MFFAKLSLKTTLSLKKNENVKPAVGNLRLSIGTEHNWINRNAYLRLDVRSEAIHFQKTTTEEYAPRRDC